MKRIWLVLIAVLFIITAASAVFFVFDGKEEEKEKILSETETEEFFDDDIKIIQLVHLRSFSDTRDDFLTQRKDFLEVNLEKEKVRLYRQGTLVKEADILALGEREHWGGSAAGLYRIKSADRRRYSTVSGVYMPYALRYYGKYYLHGEPYYPGGRKLLSDLSGGCIRLFDKDAEEFYNLVEIDLPVLVVDQERKDYFYENNFISDFPDITADAYLVADIDSGFVLAEKNSGQKRPIASIAKLMTAVVLAENANLTDAIMVRPEMITAFGSTRGLEAGQTFRVVELFYPLLIESSNNAAEVLSYFLGRAGTIRLMNIKTSSLLMPDSVFVDPHGLSEGNISTARDVFQMLRYVLMNRLPLMQISRSRLVRNFGPIKFDLSKMQNRNIFAEDAGFIGGKTGFILASRYTGAMVFNFQDAEGGSRRIAIIYLGSESDKSDVQRIHGWITENFFLISVY